MCSCWLLAALLHEDHLVDAGVLDSACRCARSCVGRADAAGARRCPAARSFTSRNCSQMLVTAGPVLAEDAVIAERVAEEAEAIEAAADRLLLVRVARHAGHHARCWD